MQVASGQSFTKISAGHEHTCAITAAGQAWCWGYGVTGGLGHGVTGSKTTPIAVQGNHAFTTISTGDRHTCAIDDDGKPWCWGEGEDGQLGRGSHAVAMAPVAVTTTETFISIAAGNKHSCGVTTAGTALCWGLGAHGRLGNGSTASSTTPAPVVGGQQYQMITARGQGPSSGHTCALATNGDAWCWGRGSVGQLGIAGFSGSVMAPTPVVGGHKFVGISAGFNHSCGVTATGAIWCWGENGEAQLGDATQTRRSSPVLVLWPQ